MSARGTVPDPRDRYGHADHPKPGASSAPQRREPCRPAQSTVHAFWYVVGLDDADYLARWLARHSDDAPQLLQIWKVRQCSPKK